MRVTRIERDRTLQKVHLYCFARVYIKLENCIGSGSRRLRIREELASVIEMMSILLVRTGENSGIAKLSQLLQREQKVPLSLKGGRTIQFFPSISSTSVYPTPTERKSAHLDWQCKPHIDVSSIRLFPNVWRQKIWLPRKLFRFDNAYDPNEWGPRVGLSYSNLGCL